MAAPTRSTKMKINARFTSKPQRKCRAQRHLPTLLAFVLFQNRPSQLLTVGNGIELEAVGLQFEPYQWRPCGVTWDSSRTVVVIKLRRTSALPTFPPRILVAMMNLKIRTLHLTDYSFGVRFFVQPARRHRRFEFTLCFSSVCTTYQMENPIYLSLP